MTKYEYKDKEWLIEQLAEHGSGSMIAKKTGYPTTSVNRWIRNHKLQKKRDFRKQNRKYPMNEEYFKKIDTEKKAYILGYLVADGCIYHNKTSYDIKWGVSEVDVDILKEIQKEFETTKPIIYLKNNMVEFKVSSKTMFEDLQKLGVQERKTGFERMPKIDKHLMKHFIRGYFDGDGSFVQNLNNYIPGGFFLCCASKDFLQDICDYFEKEIDVHVWVTKPPSQRIHRVTTTALAKTTKIYSHIYIEPEICLERKHVKIREYLKSPTVK